MSGPAVTQPSPQPSGPNAGITFDEIESQLKAAETAALAPKLDDTKVDGEDVPEALRGKTMREVLAHTKALEDTLRMSEVSRQQALTMAQLAAQRSGEPVRAKEPEPEPMITSEEVAAAFQDDPNKGIQLMSKMNEQAIARAASSFAQRIDPLLQGTVGAVEQQARQKYPDEFSLYGEEIKSILDSLPNKNAMSTGNSWDDLIAFVRGKNPQKLFDHMMSKETDRKVTDAYTLQRESAGLSMSSATRTPAPSAGVIIDETTKEVCKVLGISEADYIKWNKVN